MVKAQLRTLLLAATLAVAAFGVAQNRPIETGPQGPSGGAEIQKALKQMGLEQRLGEEVNGDVWVTNEKGERIQFKSLMGKRAMVILPMFFTCRGVCGTEVENLTKALIKMSDVTAGESYDLVLLSIRPVETADLAAAKKATFIRDYSRPGADAGVHFLTGDLVEVRKLTESFGFRYYYNPKTDVVDHPAGLVIITPKGKISRYFYGTEYSMPILKQAILAAARQEIGQKQVPIMMGCINVDPITGQRTVNIIRTLQVLCGLTLLSLVGWIGFMAVKNKDGSSVSPDDLAQGGTPDASA
jgi:protein SCO1/2